LNGRLKVDNLQAQRGKASRSGRRKSERERRERKKGGVCTRSSFKLPNKQEKGRKLKEKGERRRCQHSRQGETQ